MANHITAFHVVSFLGPLVRHMVDEYDTVSSFGMQNIMFLSLAPGFKFRPIQWIEMFRFR